MAETRSKSELWNLLKEKGWKPPATKAFVQYTAAELELEYGTLLATEIQSDTDAELTAAEVAGQQPEVLGTEEQLQFLAEVPSEDVLADVVAHWPDDLASAVVTAPPTPVAQTPEKTPEVATSGDSGPSLAEPRPGDPDWLPDVPRRDEPDAIAGLRIRTHGRNDPLRVDSLGRVWYQDEVRKPATPRPRARSVLNFRDQGSKTIEIRNQLGLLEESFEVAGDAPQDMRVKVTLPSWQVGIYQDPRLPWRVHVYNNIRGFDRLDVVEYFGGMDHVPASIKVLYVGSDLCYDIISARETLEAIAREQALQIGRQY
jgi:hypothetical protein